MEVKLLHEYFDEYLREEMDRGKVVHKEGELYKSFEIEGTRFDIYYGYESDGERQRWDPAPVYPWFPEQPQFTSDGTPFALVYQDVCEHYDPIVAETDFGDCVNCKFFEKREQFIGLCRCPKRKNT